MKRLLLVIGSLFLLSPLSFAIDLGLNLPGYLNAGYDYRLNARDVYNENKDGRLYMDFEQGIERDKNPMITGYIGFHIYKPYNLPTDDNYYKVGIKNTTLIKHVTFGIEKQLPKYISTDIAIPARWVVYFSLHEDWNLMRALDDK
jgi:hypothetical protein